MHLCTVPYHVHRTRKYFTSGHTRHDTHCTIAIDDGTFSPNRAYPHASIYLYYLYLINKYFISFDASATTSSISLTLFLPSRIASDSNKCGANNNLSDDLCGFASQRPQRVCIIVDFILFFHFMDSFKFIPFKGRGRYCRGRVGDIRSLANMENWKPHRPMLYVLHFYKFHRFRYPRFVPIALCARSAVIQPTFGPSVCLRATFIFPICRLCLAKPLIVYFHFVFAFRMQLNFTVFRVPCPMS